MMKYNLSFLILLFSFIVLASSSKYEKKPLNIAQVSGVLYEKRNRQDIMLITSRTNINPFDIEQAVIKPEEEETVYLSQLKCDYKKEKDANSYVKCKIDLSNVPSGFYKIILLFYKNEHYEIHNMLPFFVLENKSGDIPLELIDVFYNVTEYSSYQDMKLKFSGSAFSSFCMKSIDIVNDRKERFNVYINCANNGEMTSTNCHGYFNKIGADKYLIERVENSCSLNNYTYPSRNIYIQVQKKKDWELKLMNIEGKAIQGFSPLNLIFNKEVYSRNFSSFKLYNKNQLYDLWVPPIKQSNQLAVTVDFHFTYIPEGAYHLSMIYSGREYKFPDKFINITRNKYPRFNRNLNLAELYRFVGGNKKIKN